MKFNRKYVVAAAIIALIAIPLMIKAGRGESSKEVEIAVAGNQAIRPTILASGVLAYLTEVNLTSEVVAKVREILVEEGDTVEKGQLLLRLDPESYRNAIEREEASRRQGLISIQRQRLALALAEKKLERGAQLFERKMIGQSEYDDLRNGRDLARVELQSSEEAVRRADAILGEARDQFSKTDIRSPISGVIVALPIKVGETAIASTNAFAGAQLMQIADTSAIQAELKVDEADISKIAVGQDVNVYAAAYPDLALKGKVHQIALAPTLENQGRSYEVTALLETPKDISLRSGMSARADIFLGDGGEKLAVPVEAVGTDVDEKKKVTRFVWVDRDGVARKVVVQTGLSDDSWEEITSGLKPGDRVITGPGKTVRGLVEGERIRQAEAKPGKDGADDKDAGSDAEDDADTGDAGE
ncbi:efflux RND transporter periplasmic adaptor subunit [Arenimonas sp. MALMAid1274]|uniref:efflux RND transporter periplasmic adaptor subunit n=1 Tax=Arenimonas sp. MALMAid1274 TaxID=3411630 RepID=UPI003B9FB6AC